MTMVAAFAGRLPADATRLSATPAATVLRRSLVVMIGFLVQLRQGRVLLGRLAHEGLGVVGGQAVELQTAICADADDGVQVVLFAQLQFDAAVRTPKLDRL